MYAHKQELYDGKVYIAKADAIERRAMGQVLGSVVAVLGSALPQQVVGRKHYKKDAKKLFFARTGNVSRLG